jgi:hypothetical protein
MYSYETEKSELFTEGGQVLFLRIRDRVQKLLKEAGAVRMQEIMNGAGGGSTWQMLAAVDRLIELGEIRELTDGNVAGQHRVFVAARE